MRSRKIDNKLIDKLNAGSRDERVSAAFNIGEQIEKLGLYSNKTDEVNNHIHTTFSFSPYSPSRAAFMARSAGLKAAGSVDHDSIGAAKEMVEACKAFGIGSTVGCELRVNFNGTFLEEKKINNPDMVNSGYIVFHGVPHDRIDELALWLKPVNEERNRRNRAQVEKLNSLLPQGTITPLDFDRDVYSISEADNGGAITERHILYALSVRIVESFGKGRGAVDFISEKFGIDVPGRVKGYLLDGENPHYLYDLLGILKSNIVPRFYMMPKEAESPNARAAVDFANSIGAIPAYSYLGDVAESPTGDKKAEKFEDEYLDEMFPIIKELGFRAVTYMPPRNTLEQLKRVMHLCEKYDLMQISGVDINSSRQVFNCPEIMLPEFSHLIASTWALIAHEHLASLDSSLALFSRTGRFSALSLEERLKKYTGFGLAMDLKNPERIIDLVQD